MTRRRYKSTLQVKEMAAPLVSVSHHITPNALNGKNDLLARKPNPPFLAFTTIALHRHRHRQHKAIEV